MKVYEMRHYYWGETISRAWYYGVCVEQYSGIKYALI